MTEDRAMRVLHMAPSLNEADGGIVSAVLGLNAGLRSAGIDSEIITFETTQCSGKSKLDHVHVLPIQFPASYLYAPQLPAWLDRHLITYDIVVLHGMWLYPNRVIAKRCTRLGVPYCCVAHGMLEPWSMLRQGTVRKLKKKAYWHLIERQIFERSAIVIFNTDRELQAARTFLPDNGRHRVLFNVVNVPTETIQAPQRQDLKKYGETHFALFLGRVHPAKNIEFLIDAWGQARLPHDWQLVIAGTGPSEYVRSINQHIVHAGLQNNVHLCGHVSGPDKLFLLQAARWFVLASNHENFAMSAMEAMSQGCPVALSDQVYLVDYLVSPCEVLPLERDRWAEFFRDRMTSDSWRLQVAGSARESVLPRFSVDAITKAWTATLLEARNKHSHGPNPDSSGRAARLNSNRFRPSGSDFGSGNGPRVRSGD